MIDKHTPGPWTFILTDPAPLPGFAYGIGHDPFGPSDVPWPVALAVTDADARLIAAAPDLLEALEVLTAWIAKADRCDVPWPNLLREADDKARAAVKAAKGDA